MDTTLSNENRWRLSPYLCFVILASAAAVFIAVGMRYSHTIGEVSFYGRYDGITGDFLVHTTSAVVCSAPTLIQLMILYLMSYSPLLIPVGLTVIGYRGFIAGAAYCVGCVSDSLIHLAAYIIQTGFICIITAILWKHGQNRAIIKKTVALLTFAGACAILEIILSYIV